MSIGQAAGRGARWAAISQAGRQLILLSSTILLTRLVGPDNLGLLSMALTVTGFLELFKDLGTGAAIVQRREHEPGLLASIFWLNLAMGSLCAAAILIGAPLAAAVFREPDLTLVLQALSVGFLISSLSIVHLALLQRAIAFHALALIEIGSAGLGAIVGIGMGMAGFGIWSLVAQSLTAVGAATILAWVMQPWRPRLQIARGALVRIRGFSSGLVGFNLVNYFIRNADNALVGRYLGATSLGYYSLAYRLMLIPQQNLAMVGNRVMFPLLARLDDDEQFRRAYLRLCRMVALLATPVFVAMFGLAEPLVELLFGIEWMPVVPLLLILAPVGLLQSLSGTVGLIYQARGHTDWMLRWGLGAGLATLIAFVIGLRWGILGVAAGYGLVTLASLYPVFAIPFHLIRLPLARFARALLPTALCGTLMLLIILGLHLVTADLPALAQLLIPGCIGGLAYLGLSWRLAPEPLRDLGRAIHMKREA